jgi:hypothetical protein
LESGSWNRVDLANILTKKVKNASSLRLVVSFLKFYF